MKCKNCQTEFESTFCPNCGAKAEHSQPQPAQYLNNDNLQSNSGQLQPMQYNTTKETKPFYKKWWFWVVIVLAAGIVGTAVSSANQLNNLEKASEYLAAASMMDNLYADDETEAETEAETVAETEAETEEITQKPTEAPTEKATKKAKTSSKSKSSSNKPIYSKNGLKIYFTGFDDGIFSKELKFRIENDSSKSVTVSVDEMSIEGVSIDGYLYAKVGKNKKKSDSIRLSTSDLSDNDIDSDKIKKVDITFSIYRDNFLNEENPSCTINIK